MKDALRRAGVDACIRNEAMAHFSVRAARGEVCEAHVALGWESFPAKGRTFEGERLDLIFGSPDCFPKAARGAVPRRIRAATLRRSSAAPGRGDGSRRRRGRPTGLRRAS